MNMDSVPTMEMRRYVLSRFKLISMPYGLGEGLLLRIRFGDCFRQLYRATCWFFSVFFLCLYDTNFMTWTFGIQRRESEGDGPSRINSFNSLELRICIIMPNHIMQRKRKIYLWKAMFWAALWFHAAPEIPACMMCSLAGPERVQVSALLPLPTPQIRLHLVQLHVTCHFCCIQAGICSRIENLGEDKCCDLADDSAAPKFWIQLLTTWHLSSQISSLIHLSAGAATFLYFHSS